MTDFRHFEQLLAEFTRVGVDPDTFSAVLAVRPEDALRAMRELPDGAGPAAFLAKLRELGLRPAGPADVRSTEPDDVVPPVRRGDGLRGERDRRNDAPHDRTGT